MPGPVAGALQNKQAAVFVFLAPDCPLSQSYAATLNDLRMQYARNGIEFYGVFEEAAVVQDFTANYKIEFPVLIDHDFRLADFFSATKTPEAFVVDSSGHTVYKGAIDNRAPELGQQRAVITEHYVRDALGSVLLHQEIRVKQSNAVGCFIERNTAR